ncbi:MAG: hypothetical protein PHV18_02260 [Lachnospiraceae bacterium]|nr:hypothetical protein [Lachnospiraceae bacterium]
MMDAGISVLLTMVLLGFCMIPGKRSKAVDEACFTVHEGRRAFGIGAVGILLVVFLSGLAYADRKSMDSTSLLMLAALWLMIGLPGIAFLLAYMNRKIMFDHGTVTCQNLWRSRKVYQLSKLRMQTKTTVDMKTALKAREYVVSDVHGKKLFQFEENMTNAEFLVRQLRKGDMERMDEMMKYY